MPAARKNRLSKKNGLEESAHAVFLKKAIVASAFWTGKVRQALI
jgi:hypothetical protein